jgi:ArsR family transcriptional regulator
MIDLKKQKLFDKQAQIARAIAHPVRIAVIDFLKDGEQCVCDIASHVASERSNVSKHLAVMVSAGVLDSRKEGLKVIYRLKAPCILGFFDCITGVLRQQVQEDNTLLTSM